MPLTPDDTRNTDFTALAQDAVRERPITYAVIALLLGFIVGSVVL